MKDTNEKFADPGLETICVKLEIMRDLDLFVLWLTYRASCGSPLVCASLPHCALFLGPLVAARRLFSLAGWNSRPAQPDQALFVLRNADLDSLILTKELMPNLSTLGFPVTE